MLIVTRKKPKHGHEDKTYVFLHVPKCAGSHFRKVVQENVSDEFYIKEAPEDGLATHSPYQSIRKYSDGQIYLPIHSANNALSRVHAFSLLRDPLEWYDSYYYFRRSLPDRKPVESVQGSTYSEIKLEPFYAGYSLKEALLASFDGEWVKKTSFSVHSPSFCPSVWMDTFDVGIYSAWFLYMHTDHRRIFEDHKHVNVSNIDNYICESCTFFNMDQIEVLFEKCAFLKKDRPIYEKTRKTDYPEDYTSVSSILKGDSDLYEKFLHKERYIMQRDLSTLSAMDEND